MQSIRMKIRRRRGGLPRCKHLTNCVSNWFMTWLNAKMTRERHRSLDRTVMYDSVEECMKAEGRNKRKGKR
jgi:hypothetical protein